MGNFKRILVAAVATVALIAVSGVHAQVTLKLGMSVPLTGAAGVWGRGMEYTANQAAQTINDAGGVKVGGKSYKFEIVAYDNKYNSAEGTKVAQTLVNRDGVRYVVASVGIAPVRALQSVTERSGVLVFTSAAGKSVKGPKFPLTFTVLHSPYEVVKRLYPFVMQRHPNIKTVSMLTPNDASGKETELDQREVWGPLGVKIVSADYYDRGTTEFQPIAAKIAALKPDVVDLGVTPPADGGIILRELKVLGWNGVMLLPVGTSAEDLVRVGGAAVEGAYMGMAGEYEGPQSTDIQRKLSIALRGVVGEPLNAVTSNGYDAVMALKAGMEAANSIEPAAIAAVLPKILVDVSSGKAAFGGADRYGSPEQLQYPVIITQVKAGKAVELQRVIPEELTQRLAAAKK